jgi:predicted AlkP superfamily phosphohydrolase/phosphomutase
LTAIVFDSPDRLQHAFWRYVDPSLREETQAEEDHRIREKIGEHYSRLDQMIAGIVAEADPDADIFIVSDHGFGPSRECFFLNTWLAQKGYLEWADDSVVADDAQVDFSMDAIKSHGHLLNWDKTTAYVFTPSSNGLRIKIADNDSSSGVRPEDYDGFLAKLSDELRAIRHPSEGFPIVKQLWNRNEVFAGAELAPDLTMQLWDNGLVSTIKADSYIKTRSQVTGVHYPNGILIAKGPKMRRGTELEALNILDVPPMLLYSLGLSVPEDYDGRFPEEVYRPEALEADPVKKGEQTIAVDHSSEAEYERDEEEQEEIMKKLKELGYLE